MKVPHHNVTPTRHETRVARPKVSTYLEFYHVAQFCLNICDIIISAYVKFLWCYVTSLIYCFLEPSQAGSIAFWGVGTTAGTGDLSWRLMTTLEGSSLTGPEIFMVVFSHEKEKIPRKNNKFGNRPKNFAIYKRFDSRRNEFLNISKSSSFMCLQNSSKP